MRIAIVVAAISVLGAGTFHSQPRDALNAVPIKVVKVHVVKDPVIPAELFSPKPMMTIERDVASIDTK
jgi:hypothetical protein